ncbi:MAG TPA: cytochrome c oxidase assembly protein [Chloroflexota bacterium]|nr:cytochrome c oxidase assembly protein [Chloroflexota bacterium]
MLVIVGCVAAAWLYSRGLHALWQHAGQDRGVRRWQAACFVGGLLVLLIALVSPLDELAAALFSAHMVQHLLLLLVAPPLLVLGLPLVAFAWALPESARQSLRIVRYLHRLTWPAAAFVLHSLVLWAWHVPRLYDGAVANPPLHVLEHMSFLGSAVLFWWALLSGARASYGAGVLYVFGMALQSTLLGALLTFAGSVWYTAHVSTTAAFGITPQEDQQLAGLIMWIPGGSIYLACALALFAAWLKESGTPDPAARTPARR